MSQTNQPVSAHLPSHYRNVKQDRIVPANDYLHRYFGELAGMVTLLAARDAPSWQGAEALLIGQGLPPRTARAVWNAAAELGRDGNR